MDTQSKYRIVADVIGLCDENDRLREQVRTIDAAEREQREVTATASLSITDAYFMEMGKRAAVKKAIENWRNELDYDRDTNTYQSFESWCDQHIQRGMVPDCMSVTAFRDACDAQLREVYDEKLAEAIKENE